MDYTHTPENIAANMGAHERELHDVFTERLRQLRKFGPQNRLPYQWHLILAEEVGEVAKELVEMEFDDAVHPYADPERYYKELTEVAAVALAAMQNFNQRRPKCFHDPEEGGCNLCTRRVPPPEPIRNVFPPACPHCLQRPDQCLCHLPGIRAKLEATPTTRPEEPPF